MLTHFDEAEIVIGKRIGGGKLCDVLDVLEFRQQWKIRELLDEHEGFIRDFLSRSVRHTKSNKPRYAIKLVKKSEYEGRHDQKAAVMALRDEVWILRNVSHPNIIKLIGVPLVDYIDSEYCSTHNLPSYFFLMEKINEKLEDRIALWKRKYQRLENPRLKVVIDRRGVGLKDLYIERLKAAVELASAVEYLHLERYLHGNLEPSNVGFSVTGTLILFDFDRAHKSNSMNFRGEIYTKGCGIGSRRYSCPEVIKGLKYRQSSEVYSFAMIVYEILALQQPFQNFTEEEFNEKVLMCGDRLTLPQDWSHGIQSLLNRAWHLDESIRPNMTEIHKTLVQELMMEMSGRLSEDLSVPLTSFKSSSSPSQGDMEDKLKVSKFVNNQFEIPRHSVSSIKSRNVKRVRTPAA
jgi:serine/threonine protein kinase